MQHHRSSHRHRSAAAVAVAAAASLPFTVVSARAVPAQTPAAASPSAQARAQALSEKQRFAPALTARLAKSTTVPYAVFARAPFEPIFAESTPAPKEIPAAAPLTLRIFACAEETEPATFAVFAGKALKNATVTAPADFVSESKQSRLPRAAVDVHVVRALPVPTDTSRPELLIKDDREALNGPVPTVRLTGDPRTDIAAGTTKQFWITVRVPKGQSPSVLTGKLVFSATGVKPTPITLAVEVLPMRLRTPFLQYGIDFRSRLAAPQPTTGEAAAAGQPNVGAVTTREVFALQLRNIRDHGFRFVSLYDDAPGALTDAFNIIKETGLTQTGPAILHAPVSGKSDVEAIEKLRADAGLRPDFDFYYSLEGLSVEAAKEKAKAVHAASRRALTVAPIPSQSVYDALGEAADVPVYSVASEYSQRLLQTGRRENNRRDWWSWDIATETPVQNRLYAGHLLYRTGLNSSPLYGAFAGPYQALTGDDPYGVVTTSKPSYVAYPVENGVLDTLQWEATREGVDDIRYITNLKTYLREVKDLKIRKEVTDEAEAFLAAQQAKPVSTLTPAQLQTVRRGIADRALKLLTILRGSAKRYPD